MFRFLGLDYGEKRIGIALTDPLKIFSKPFTVIFNTGFENVLKELKNIVKSQNVNKIIVGLPLNLKGEDTKKTIEVREFTEKLQASIEVDIEFQDERYTSVDAEQSLKESGHSIMESRQKVDAVAASLILRSYLNRVQ